MTYGITGNETKDGLWKPVAHLIQWFSGQHIPFLLAQRIYDGLVRRGQEPVGATVIINDQELAGRADIVLSFGGDGTLLSTAHAVGPQGTPILGVNVGRLGFLAAIEVGHVVEAIKVLEKGAFEVERRMVMQVAVESGAPLRRMWALNEIVVERSGSAKMIAINVSINGQPLNTYWNDGLILTTPTGSTAYNLSAGGPIVSPRCDVMVITPVAPHMLTVRPIVLPGDSVVELRFEAAEVPVVLAADGMSTVLDDPDITVVVRRADHTVNLIKLPDQHFFDTLRSKLSWGIR